MRSDEELIKSIKEDNDEEAFHELYNKYESLAFRCASGFVFSYGPEMVEEICIDVWVKVWSNIDRFRGDCKFSTWLYEIVKRTSLTYIGRVIRNPVEPVGLQVDSRDKSEEQENYASTAERVVIAKEIAMTLADIMVSYLTQREYEILRLKFLGLSSKDIAERLRTTPNSVDVLLNRAKTKIRPRINEQYGYPAITEVLEVCMEYLIKLLLSRQHNGKEGLEDDWRNP